jgi:hypothetical protein
VTAESVVRPEFVPSGAVVGDEALRIHRAAHARGGSKKSKVEKAEVLVIPEPEIRGHVIDWTEKTWPMGMRTIGNLATKQGFIVVASHARGPYVGDVPLRVMRICDSILLRMRHEDGRAASALWYTDNHGDWGLECLFLLTPWLQQVKSPTFKDYLRTPREPALVEVDGVVSPVVDLDGYDVSPSVPTAPTEGAS